VITVRIAKESNKNLRIEELPIAVVDSIKAIKTEMTSVKENESEIDEICPTGKKYFSSNLERARKVQHRH